MHSHGARFGLHLALAGALVASPAAAVLTEIDLGNFGDPVSQATLDADDEATPNPADGSAFTSWAENGATVTPDAGEEGFFESGNGQPALRFAMPAGFGDGTAVIVFDEAQCCLAVEVGFQQQTIRVSLFEDAAGTLPLGDLILSDPEVLVPSHPLFAIGSDTLFRRAEVQHVDALGELQNSNAISDLRFSAVPEPSRAVLLVLAGAALFAFGRRS